MKTIKFRVYITDDSKMQDVIVLAICNDGVMKPLVKCSDGNRAYKDYPLMQSTGFKDTANNQIYEGDIIGEVVETDQGPKQCNFPVLWWEKKGMWAVDISLSKNGFCLESLADELKSGNYTVIGNIYENPELLKA